MLSYTVNHTVNAETRTPPASRSIINQQQPEADSKTDHHGEHHEEDVVTHNEDGDSPDV